MDRKKAYLQETAAHDRTPVNADDDECVVEYDSDDEEHGDNTRAGGDIKNKNNDSTAHEEAKTLPDRDNKTAKDVSDDAVSEQLSGDTNEVEGSKETEDDKNVVSPKKRKMIGASLGPLRKRNRRRSSEVCNVKRFPQAVSRLNAALHA